MLYYAFSFFIITSIVLIVSFFTSYTNKNAYKVFSLTSFIIAFILLGISIVIKYQKLGWVPVTNNATLLILISLGIAFFSLIIITYKKNILLLTIPSFLISLIIGLTIFNEPSPDQNGIISILQNNIFLIPHVSTIILGYASLILAMIFSHIILWKNDNFSYLSSTVAFLLQISSFLLVLGIIIGATWAENAWGHFWSWDPKESWALITFLITLIVLIGYREKLLSEKVLAFGVIASFFSVIVTWYGINFLFRVGLHSYGFNNSFSNYHPFILGIIIFEITFLFVLYLKRKRNN